MFVLVVNAEMGQTWVVCRQKEAGREEETENKLKPVGAQKGHAKTGASLGRQRRTQIDRSEHDRTGASCILWTTCWPAELLSHSESGSHNFRYSTRRDSMWTNLSWLTWTGCRLQTPQVPQYLLSALSVPQWCFRNPSKSSFISLLESQTFRGLATNALNTLCQELTKTQEMKDLSKPRTNPSDPHLIRSAISGNKIKPI